MADCQYVKSLSWSCLPFHLAFLFISIPTKCFLLYDKAKLWAIFTLLGEQLLESKLDHSCHNAISLCITIAGHQLQQSQLYQWKGTAEGSEPTQWSDPFIQAEQWKTWTDMLLFSSLFFFFFRKYQLHKRVRGLCVNIWDVCRMYWFQLI